jgi:hypothetical protein
MSDESKVPVTVEAWEQAMEAEFQAFLEETRAAMNAAREGHWITDTEEVVREAGARLRQRALEKLLQLQVQAEESSFSPSQGQRLAGEGSAVYRAPDGGGSRANSSAGVVEARERSPRAGRPVAERRGAAD